MSAPLAITMGDACGIGPEIIAQLFRTPHAAGCVVLGDLAVMRRAVSITGGLLAVAPIASVQEWNDVPPNCLPVLAAPGVPADLSQAAIGHIDARAGAAAARCIEAAARMALDGQVAVDRHGTHPQGGSRRGGHRLPGAHRDAAGAGCATRCTAAAGAHDAGQRRAAHGAGHHPPVPASCDRGRDLRCSPADAAHCPPRRGCLGPGAAAHRRGRSQPACGRGAVCSATKSS